MRQKFFSVLATVILAACGQEAEVPTEQPLFEQVNIFEAETGGYAHYRVPAIAVSPKGTVLAFVEARKNSSGDWGTQDIMMRRSTDSGETWEEPRIIAR